MARVFPFRALRYNTSKIKLEDVLTQPYDKITPEMQERYYRASPHNLIAFELGRNQPRDTANDNVYTRAAHFLRERRTSGVLSQDYEPSIYAYAQRFTVPGDERQRFERRGFVALCQLSDYHDGVVHRHEHTLTKPKEDRLNLLRATRTHSGQIFMLYSDPERKVDELVWRAAEPRRADALTTDEYGVEHLLWKISQPEVISVVQAAMADKKLIIADGHHRYETALAYRNERRAAGGPGLMNDGAPYEKVMATFVNMDAPGLVILPTHRVLARVPGFSAEKLISQAKRFFEVEELEATVASRMLQRLARLAGSTTAFVAVTRDGAALLKAKGEAVASALKDLSPKQAALDVVQLHRIVLSQLLGVSEQDVREQSYVTYHRSAEEALQKVRQGADAAFLMNPVTMAQMREVAFAGEVMPQKSTDFYPKPMSGITLYSLD